MEKLGKTVKFNFNQEEIKNINILLKGLKNRLNAVGKMKSKDNLGNDMFVDVEIYSTDELVSFLCMSLSNLNLMLKLKMKFSDETCINDYHELLVQGATIKALASKALLERGREFAIEGNDISFTPPSISDALTVQWQTELHDYMEKIKLLRIG